MFRKIKPKDRLILKAVVCCLYRYRTISEKVDALISWSVKLHRSWIGLPVASSVRMDCQCCLCNLVAFPTRIGLPILSVILELPLSVRGVGRRTQPISKLLNDLLITSALNPTYFSELLSNLYYSPIKKLENIFIKLLGKSVINYKSRSKAIVYDFVEKVFGSKKTKLYEENS